MNPEERRATAPAAFRPWTLKVANAADLAPAVTQLGGHMNERQRVAFHGKLERYVRKPDRDVLLAVSGSDVLGFLAVIEEAPPPEGLSVPVAERLRRFASCTGLFVDPLHRRRGIGAGLVHRAEQWARERRSAGLWLVTHRVASWYERHLGYEVLAAVQVKGVIKTVIAKSFSDSSHFFLDALPR